MHKQRYARASWSLLVTDLKTGRTVYELDPDRLAFTGSVRKLFSVGVALNKLGADYRFRTPVYRQGSIGAQGVLEGNLTLVAAGDLTLGGRQTSNGLIAFTNFDHNDANNLGTAILTPQNPLSGLDELARQVRSSGIRTVNGDVIVDTRLFDSHRVPNGNLLISPMMVNENLIDVWVTSTAAGEAARIDWRPQTAAFSVDGSVKTVPAGAAGAITLSSNGRVAGNIPIGYKAPLSGSPTFVGTFRIEDPASYARIAFVEALARAGVSVHPPTTANNVPERLPERSSYNGETRVAELVSPPYSEYAKLILKVSLNLGANLSLTLFGLTEGQHTMSGALAAERNTLVDQMGINAHEFDFPTNGSGSPDSRAAPRATVKMLAEMSKRPTYNTYRAALPILGVDGSLAGSGLTLPAKGHVFAKTGTTISDGNLKAQVLAGYIDVEGNSPTHCMSTTLARSKASLTSRTFSRTKPRSQMLSMS